MVSTLSAVPADQLRTENDAVIEFARAQGNVEEFAITDPNGEAADTVFAAVPKGKELVSVKKFIDEYRKEPERRTGTAVLNTEDSFVAHVQRYEGPSTAIFARRDKTPQMLAVYNYHPAGDDQRKAGFGDFRAAYTFPLSDEWTAWIAKNEVQMVPTDFAQFLDDRLIDVYALGETEDDEKLKDFAREFGGTFASPTKMLELSRSIEINATVGVRQAARLESGEINIAFTEEHRDGDGKPIRVPSMFVIGIPIFVDGIRYKIICRLRYRLMSGDGITWMYSMVRPRQYLDDAVKESVDSIDDAVGSVVFYGEPEKR